jgi:tetratricopeptide (TPR) repeat protein
MKKNHLFRATTVIMALVIVASCGGLKKMAKNISLVTFTSTPKPLVMQAGKVTLNMTAAFPAKYFDPKAVVEVTPVLNYGEQKKELKPITLQGEKVQNNFTKVSTAGGTVTYSDTFDYDPAMKVSTVTLKIRAWQDGKEAAAVVMPYEQVINVGIITSSELIPQAMREDVLEGSNDQFRGTTFAKVVLPEKTVVPYSAIIRYQIQRADLGTEAKKNAELTQLVSNVQNATGSNLTYLGTEISSYASPDGPEDLNEGLVAKRGNTAEGYMSSQLKKAKIQGAVKKATTAAEDWDGFRAELQNSNIQDKEIILRVLSMHQDAETREKEIKNIAEAYEDLKDKILPLLRRSEIKINFESPQRPSNQILDMAVNAPAKLTEVELLHGATLPTDLNQRKAVYQNFVTTYPNDWRGPNNLGVVMVALGDNTGAKAQFEKANTLSNGNGIVRNNLGVMAAMEGNFEKAAEYFKNANVSDPAVQKQVDYNLGSVASAKGNYDEGNSKLSGTGTINEALTKLMKGDNSGARTAINAAKSETGLKYYVKAIVEARDKNKDAAIENLSKAVAKDPSLKLRAATDMEFYEMMNDSAFKALL